MSGFQSYRDLIGAVSTEAVIRRQTEFLTLARDVRIRLGNQAFLLDNYLAFLIEASNNTLSFDACGAGFDSYSELRCVCRDVLQGESRDHSFWNTARDFIEKHPLSYQDIHTKVALYDVMLAGKFLTYAAESFRKKQEAELRGVLDLVELRQLREEIGGLLAGREEMDLLDQLFQEGFMLVTPMTGFLQGFLNDLLYDLTLRDAESSKQALQLLLEMAR